MGRVLLFISLIFCALAGRAATIKWDGGGGNGIWSTATNWVGDVAPGATDDVILDNSVVAGSYTVTLPTGAVSVVVNSLTITPAGANTIILLNPVTNTSSTAFTATGPGDAVILNSGAIFKNSSGAASGTPVGVTMTNFFRINNGGRYIHNCNNGHTTTLVARLSSAPGTENGTFQFDVPAASFTFSLNARVYGNLEFSSTAHGGPVTYVTSGSMISKINNNLLIHSGVTLTLDFTNDIMINGNLNQEASSTFNLSNSTGSPSIKIKGNINSAGIITETGTGLPEIQLNGVSNQNIAVMGNIINSVTLNMNNALGATLQSPLTLPFKLLLVNGRIKTTGLNLLAMADNAIYTGGSVASFIEGPMKKLGDDNFIFPIGLGNMYCPLGISNGLGQAITDEFTAEYRRGNPGTSVGNILQAPVDHISSVEYWQLNRVNGTASKLVSLAVNFTSFCYDLSHTAVGRYDGSQWILEPSSFVSGPVAPPFMSGTVASTAMITSFGSFTLATDLPAIANPLPLKLISFQTLRLSSEKTLLEWETADYVPSSVRFEIQKAQAIDSFTTIGAVSGDNNRRFYKYIDDRMRARINYYRLKMIDIDGVVSYSKTLTVLNEQAGPVFVSLRPSAISRTAILVVASPAETSLRLVIVDMQGRVIRSSDHRLEKGSNNIELYLDRLAAGIYQVKGVTAEGVTMVIRCIKL